MATQRRYPKEEFGRRGDAIYEQKIRPHLKPRDTMITGTVAPSRITKVAVVG